MQTSTFLQIHNLISNLNRDGLININYDDTSKTQNYEGSLYIIGEIKGLTVAVNRKSNNSADSNFNTTNILQQIEKISFDAAYRDFPVQNIELEVKSRSLGKGINEKSFFYFDVKPKQFVRYWPEATFLSGTVIDEEDNITTGEPVYFFPTITNINFSLNDYNPLIGNSIENRPSRDKQVADRDNLNTNPVNINPLLSQSAPPAQIPDSNYSITGLINSRYEGSKTDAEKFGGVSPSFTGRTFTGEVFSNVVTNSKISASLEQDRVYKELFHSGEEELPGFKIVSSSYQLDATAGLSNSFFIESISEPSSGSLVNSGDIIFLSGSTNTQEFMRVERINTKVNKLFVERAYLSDRGIDSTKNAHDTKQIIKLIQPTKLFEFGSGTTKVELVENAKVLVKESRLILETDKYGNVFTSASLDSV